MRHNDIDMRTSVVQAAVELSQAINQLPFKQNSSFNLLKDPSVLPDYKDRKIFYRVRFAYVRMM
jgi:hypothetical protein